MKTIAYLISLCLCLSLSLGIGIAIPAALATESASPGIGSVQSLKQLYQDLDLLFRQGFAATQSGDFVTAEDRWTKAIELAPNNPAAWSNRGNARISQYHLQAALDDFNQAIELAPNIADPYINRGIAWEGLGEWQKAIEDYDRAIVLDPQDPVSYNNRANAKGGSEDWAGAVADFKLAAEIAPGFAAASVNYALALYQLGEVEESTRLLKNLVRKYSQFADPRAALTAVLWGQGRRGEAESNWYPVIGLDPRYKDINWLTHIRRWPPLVVTEMERFLQLN
jgi:tetratricopeptide (TPR) repeat protein